MSGLTSSACHQTADVSRVVSGSKSFPRVHRQKKKKNVLTLSLFVSTCAHFFVRAPVFLLCQRI